LPEPTRTAHPPNSLLAQEDNPFLGVAAGDADASSAVLWTRINRAQTFPITAQVSTDAGFGGTLLMFPGTSDATKDNTAKVTATGLTSDTRYFYRFVINATGETSSTGTFKTTPLANVAAPLHFAFSGDNDGLMRPYALANVLPSQHLDFYLNLGDVIYETASNLTTSGPHNGQLWLTSPSVTLSNDALTFNGIPRAFIPAGAPFATQAQLKADYEKKYRENFLPVNVEGQNSLQVLYAAQGNYTTWDNHELGNRKYIDGGAPAGGSVGGAAGTDMATGRGVDARAFTGSNTGGSGNINNVNDAADLLSPIDLANLGGFMNHAVGFQTLQNVFLEYQPIADRGTVNAPSDPRTNGTKQLYSAAQWGRNALFVNTDSRSYRDIRLKTANAGADDTGPRADNPNRTYLGATQLAWLKQTLLDAQNNGTTWKFVSVSDPIDQLGPIGGALAGTLTSVNADGGKSYMGGYRAERNALLKFIADNNITNVVFLSTDDHQNRINELYYSSSGQTDVQSSYVKVPYTFAIVCGPLGATGPETILDHSFANIKAIADSLANAQTAAGLNPVGLENYPGLHNLVREGDPTAGTSPQAVDFYSPDTFNFTVLDVSANGKTLTVSSVGMNSTAQNAGIEYANGPQARTIFSFQIDGLNQTIAFGPLANKTFGDAPFAVSATASSGLPVSFAASGNCTVSGAVVTLTGAGSCTITASQPGDANFSPALDISRTFSIARAAVTATAGSGIAIYDGFTKTPSNCVVSGPYVGSLVCVNSPALVGPAPGTTVISPVVSGDTLSNFDITPVNGSYTIGSLNVSTQSIRTELNNALATATNRKDIEKLTDAIKKLDDALDPELWLPDGNHLKCQHGQKVFDLEADAVEDLMELIRDTCTPAIPDATLQGWINILVAIDRNLAQTAIMEANVPGADRKKIAAALEALAKGDADAARGKYDKAIQDYGNAWTKIKEC
jgi:phosphodiesterase/alkaline phosphatase D-like protein